MSEIYGGHLVAKYMKEVEKIDTVFTLSGGHIENILDGFTEYDIRTIDVRHEQAAAMKHHSFCLSLRKSRLQHPSRPAPHQNLFDPRESMKIFPYQK